MGVAFQIQDDILDVTSTVEVLGKPIHSDEKNEKTTYVTLLGIENAKEAVESFPWKRFIYYTAFQGKIRFLEMLLKELIYRENKRGALMVLERIQKEDDIKKLKEVN